MAQEIEIEVKTMITENIFKTLLQSFHLASDEAIIQHNHYFETASFILKARHAALRIREREETFTLTLKQPHDAGVLETHQTLSSTEAEQALKQGIFPRGDVRSALEEINVPLSQLEYLGTLTTHRIEISYKGGILCLDKSSYFDVIDYEIEFEGTSIEHAETTLSQLLDEFGLTKQPTQNKVRRFFARKAQV